MVCIKKQPYTGGMALNRWLWAMMVVLACIGMLQWIEHPVILNYLGLGAAAVLAVVGCSKKCREFANKGPGAKQP